MSSYYQSISTHFKKEDEEKKTFVEFKSDEIKIPDESKVWDDFLVGQCGFANVYQVRIHRDLQNEKGIINEKAALKRFKFDRFATDDEKRKIELVKLKREAEIVNRVSHQNIIHLFGVCYDSLFFGLVLELCEGGSLGNVCRSIKKKHTIILRVLADWAHQISSAMKYLTDRSILHRDLKADNVLVKQPVCFCVESERSPFDSCHACENRPMNKLLLKITDFGMSKTLMSAGDSVVGTLVWLAPEVFQQQPGQSNWSEFSDVWSFGVVLWELLARKMPHVGEYPIVVAHWNQNGQTLTFEENWPQKWKEIMRQCWSLDPKQRLTFSSLVEYFEEYAEGLVEVHISELEHINKKKKRTCFTARKSKMKTSFTTKKDYVSLAEDDAHHYKKYCIASCVGFPAFIILLIAGYFILSPSEVFKICSEGYEYYDMTGFCYKVSIVPVVHKVATAICEVDGATLASIHSPQENKFALNLYLRRLKENRLNDNPLLESHGLWFGLVFDFWKNDWVWSDGSEGSYRNWRVEESSRRKFSWTALHANTNGKWGTYERESDAAYICKKPTIKNMSSSITVSKHCADGYKWLKSTQHCYKISFDSLRFEQATKTCAKENAHLISIHSKHEHSELVKFYKIELNNKFEQRAWSVRSHLWLGLTFNNSSWSWSDGTSFDYSNWKTNRSTNPDYVLTVVDIDSHRPAQTLLDYWKNVGPSNFFPFICQKDDISKPEKNVRVVLPKMRPLKAPEVDKTHKNCSNGYIYFDKTGFCYKSGTKNVKFPEANETCEAEGGHVASIHSKEENQFVIDLVKNTFSATRIYTGLYFSDDEWKYTDGTFPTYTNWVSNEPNFLFADKNTIEDHVTIVLENWWIQTKVPLDKWNNQRGDFEHAYVCKIKPF